MTSIREFISSSENQRIAVSLQIETDKLQHKRIMIDHANYMKLSFSFINDLTKSTRTRITTITTNNDKFCLQVKGLPDGIEAAEKELKNVLYGVSKTEETDLDPTPNLAEQIMDVPMFVQFHIPNMFSHNFLDTCVKIIKRWFSIQIQFETMEDDNVLFTIVGSENKVEKIYEARAELLSTLGDTLEKSIDSDKLQVSSVMDEESLYSSPDGLYSLFPNPPLPKDYVKTTPLVLFRDYQFHVKSIPKEDILKKKFLSAACRALGIPAEYKTGDKLDKWIPCPSMV